MIGNIMQAIAIILIIFAWRSGWRGYALIPFIFVNWFVFIFTNSISRACFLPGICNINVAEFTLTMLVPQFIELAILIWMIIPQKIIKNSV
jgi:hypothetical protein